VTDEAVIADLHQLADKGMGLYLTIPADLHIFLYLCKRADEGMIADGAAVQVHRLDNDHILPECNIRGNRRLFDAETHSLSKFE
jgi:hypothetical protein